METGRARTIAGGYLTRVARARKRLPEQRIVVAIRDTIRLVAEMNKAIPKWPIE
jgi:hypothetical protein